jgi:hypothetical protein
MQTKTQLYVQAVIATLNQSVFINYIDVLDRWCLSVTKKLIFYTVVESILSYSYDILTVDYRFKKKLLTTEMYFLRSAARTSKTLKVRKEVIRNKM